MTNGELLSLIAVCLSFVSVLASFVFSYRKAVRERDQERESNIQNIAEIKSSVKLIKTNVDEIKEKVEKIDEKMLNDHERIIEHEQKIKNLEKVVFKGGNK